MKVEEQLPYGFEDTSFQAAGGFDGIKALVKSFYHFMDNLPEAKIIRDMHPDDLSESTEKLSRFLCGWLGGPNKYREKYGPINIPNAHAYLNIKETERDAWLMCMEKAIATQPYSEKFAVYLFEQFKIPANRIVKASQVFNATATEDE